MATYEKAKKHGYACAGICRIISPKDRAKGMTDAEICLDGDRWDEWSEAEQDALLDHELQHLELRVDSKGRVKRDDLDRPKLKMRKHDHQFGWFDDIARRHGEASFEVQQARDFRDESGQLYFFETGKPSLAMAGA